MKKNYLKKPIAILVALVMAFMLAPGSVYAAEAEPAGSFYFCMEKGTIGQGYLIEPQKVPFYEGDNVGKALIRFFNENGIEADYGSESMFYLACIKDSEGSLTASFPQYIIDAEPGLNETRENEWLGEFDYNNMSGWVFKDNNVHSPVGASGVKLEDGDVERFAFTVTGLGSDCWNTGWGDPIAPESVNYDPLIKVLADFNGREDKEDLLKFSGVAGAYQALNKSGNDYTVKEEVINAQIETMQSEIEVAETEVTKVKAIEERIAALESITLEDKEEILSIREEINTLSESGRNAISNIELLDKAEAELAELEKQEADKESENQETGKDEESDTDVTEQETGKDEESDTDVTEQETGKDGESDTDVAETDKDDADKTIAADNNVKEDAEKTPETGDTENLILWMFALSTTIGAAVMIRRKASDK